MNVLERAKAVLTDPSARMPIALFVGTLTYYAALIRVQYTFGDGPELLTAMYRLGGSHPSGYPLFTLLGYIPAHIGIPSPWWLVSFCVAAIPGALAVVFLYFLLRELETQPWIAVLGALGYGMNTHVVYQSTRVEVYALHCFFLVFAFWGITRFFKTDQIRYVYIATFATCLALTNHLTSAFLVIPLTVGMLLGNRHQILKVKTIATLLGIAIVTSLIYLYLPLQAMANVGDRISWNDPQTLERFWFHVSGQEYQIFRNWDKIVPTLNKFEKSIGRSFFPGMLVISALGIIEIAFRRWKLLIVMLGFQISAMIYIGSYSIRDISTYYTGLYLAMIVTFAVGADWIFHVRFHGMQDKLHDAFKWFVITLSIAWIGGMAINSRSNGYKEAVAQEMSEAVMADLEEPALLFTSVDGHSFPMWYQIYVEHPDVKAVPVDTVMFQLKNKGWYRDFFRKNYPWITWPSDAVVNGGKWREWLIENNPDVNFYAMLAHPWRRAGSYSLNRGWHNKIFRGVAPALEQSVYVKHIFVARQNAIRGHKYFFGTVGPYSSGKEKLACIVEWTSHPGLSATWKFHGPSGQEISFKPHGVPKGNNQSWEYLEIKDQAPGLWTCEVTNGKERPIRTTFTLK